MGHRPGSPAGLRRDMGPDGANRETIISTYEMKPWQVPNFVVKGEKHWKNSSIFLFWASLMPAKLWIDVNWTETCCWASDQSKLWDNLDPFQWSCISASAENEGNDVSETFVIGGHIINHQKAGTTTWNLLENCISWPYVTQKTSSWSTDSFIHQTPWSTIHPSDLSSAPRQKPAMRKGNIDGSAGPSNQQGKPWRRFHTWKSSRSGSTKQFV